MPYERFTTLKPKKKQLVFDSIETIVKGKELDSISISDITSEAEISRGTFYTYFKDKNDAIFTLFNNYYEKIYKSFIQILDEENGDFFKSVRKGKDELISFIKKKDMLLFLQNVSSNYNLIYSYRNVLYNDFKNFYDYIYQKVDIKKYVDKEKFFIIVDMVITTVASMVFRIVLDINKNVLNKEFEYKLSIIEKSIKSK